ncbi:MAG: endonuclease [Candidatus Buchananbacteria bacterium RIFCSPLOWO2_01_FULL_46_12]|uniref:Endonuclease n=2 Tax=Candidatus Buchananiibacteriota TaxID=1817903 RepID=A0A1G1YNN1_9BACT|nr:MAG: endonuclease [Candidatus Buchananbacteria bacterium RIFCSPHIGHO2_01_FULL_44_11]OGY53972.1 MAG: endonuclease [Candidatus Buchananbacteria bacterium RIFCSPLOWO2_01_FULL_46_12]
MYFVYILQSLKDKSYYVGHTENLKVRFKRHNSSQVRSTKSRLPWQIVYQEQYQTKQEAYRRELQIKSYKGGEAFKKLLNKKDKR